MKYNISHINVDFEKIIFRILFISTLLSYNFSSVPLKAQIAPITTSCYCIEEGGYQPNTLFELNNTTWVMKGALNPVGVISPNGKIEAFAAKPNSNLLYAVDKNVFGTINVDNLTFTALSYVGNQKVGFGEYGNQLFDDIDAMAYDPYSHVIWATNRNPGVGPGTEDFLIKINPDTGHFVPGVFENGYDYAVIPSVFDGTFGTDVYDVDGIAYNPYTGLLYTIQNQEGPGVVTSINTMDGGVESVIYDMGEDDIEGLGISTYGQLFGTSGDHGTAESSFIFIDLQNGSTQNLAPIDPTKQYKDFESFDCALGIFDLAMKVELAPNQNNITANSTVSFNITIKNQGSVEVDSYRLSAYLPIGLSLNDNSWNLSAVGNQTINKRVTSKINPGQTKVVTLSLKVANLPPPSLQLAAEISEFYNATIDQVHGYEIQLPDIDSTPDNIDNENRVVDNEMTEGGPKVNKDEDDHDIVNFMVKNVTCQSNLNITGNINDGSYTAGQTISSNGNIASSRVVQFRAGTFINLDGGFTANTNTTFEITIQDCP